MAYTPKTWIDYPNTTTPITAAELNNIDQGVRSRFICTSSTRPAAPFDGQKIYETDTDLEWVWDGSSWTPPEVQTPSVHVYRNTAGPAWYSGLSIGSHVTFTTVEHDNDGMYDPTFNERITIQTPGVYHVSGGVYMYSTTFTTNAVKGLQVVLEVNTTTGTTNYFSANNSPAHNANLYSCMASVQGHVKCSAGDYIRVLPTTFAGSVGTGLALQGLPTQRYNHLAATLISPG